MHRRCGFVRNVSFSHHLEVVQTSEIKAFAVVISVIAAFSLMCFTNTYAQGQEYSATPLGLLSDASGLFNERGYYSSNSFERDGHIMVNDFNGNLMYTQNLDYNAMSQNGVHSSLQIVYNGSVGHLVNTHLNPAACGKQLNINLPEWIISVNGIAVQTFNFENEVVCLRDAPAADTATNNSVSALVVGYHTCYRAVDAGGCTYGTISILMGDGSVREYYSGSSASSAHGVRTGEYRSHSRDDDWRGYVDTSANFTLFQGDGVRVHFKKYTPTWRHTPTIDVGLWMPVMYLPTSFVDQMGHEVAIEYYEDVYGRPFVTSVGGTYKFLWDGLASAFGLGYGLVLSDGLYAPPEYVIHFSNPYSMTPGWADDANRAQVRYIRDGLGRVTNFNYEHYYRRGLNIALDNCNPIQTLEEPTAFSIWPMRISSIELPSGGKTYFSYYDDERTAWGSQYGSWDDLTIDYTPNLCWYDANPCKRTAAFDDLGRDPYFTNIVVRTTRVNVGDTLVGWDSLAFQWHDPADGQQGDISVRDTLITIKRQYDAVCAGNYPTKKRVLCYQEYPDNGVYSSKSRDRGWELKLIHEALLAGECNSPEFEMDSVYWVDQIWDVYGDAGLYCNCYVSEDAFCCGTFLLKEKTEWYDGVPNTTTWERDWYGADSTSDEVSNLTRVRTTDAWGLTSEQLFDSSYYGAMSSPVDLYLSNLPYYSSVKRDDSLITSQGVVYYEVGDTTGYPGLVKRKVTYEIEGGAVTDSAITTMKYVRACDTCDPLMYKAGALREVVNPMGNRTVMRYYEKVLPPPGYSNKTDRMLRICPVLYKLWNEDGSVDDYSETMPPAGPFWYRLDKYLSEDAVVIPDSAEVLVGGSVDTVLVRVSVYESGTQTKEDTVNVVQTVPYELRLPDMGKDRCCGDDYATIMVLPSGEQVWDTLQYLTCQASVQVVNGQYSASIGDRIKVSVSHGCETYSDGHRAEFTHRKSITAYWVDTVLYDTVPDAVSYYQHPDVEGNPQEVVGANLFFSEAVYDIQKRVSSVTLPGNWGSEPPTAEQHLLQSIFPFLDGDYSDDSLVIEHCDSTVLLFVDTTMEHEGTPRRLPYLSFCDGSLEALDVDTIQIDSATLDIYCIQRTGISCYMKLGRYLKAYDQYADCGTSPGAGETVNFYMSAHTGEWISVDVSGYVSDWVDGTSPYLQAFDMRGTDCDMLIATFASSEYADSTKWPRLVVYYTVPARFDSVYAVRYAYDDELSDGDGISITSLVQTDTADSYRHMSRARFDGQGRQVQSEVWDSAGTHDSLLSVYDGYDRIVRAVDQLGYATTSKFDGRDRVTRVTYPDTANSYVHTLFGHASANTQGLGSFLSMYDDNLYVADTYDENGNVTREYSDVRGTLRATVHYVDGDSVCTYFDYDDLGNLTTVIKPQGDSVNYRYNSLGWLLKEWPSNNGITDYDTIFYWYDKNGNMIRKQDGKLATLNYMNLKYYLYNKYDALNRVIESGRNRIDTLTDSVHVEVPIKRYFYDQESSALSNGKLSYVHVDPLEPFYMPYGEKYDYDPRGRLTLQTEHFWASLDSTEVDTVNGRWEYGDTTSVGFEVAYEYNLADQVTKVTYPDGMEVTYSYDNRGRLTAVGNGTVDDYYANLEYTPRNELSVMRLGNYAEDTTVQQVDYDYNARGWLDSINGNVADSGMIRDQFRQRLYYYEYPDSSWSGYKNGNILAQRQEQNGLVRPLQLYEYDDLDRLTMRRKSQGDTTMVLAEEFEYDKNGNRTMYREGATNPYYYVYDSLGHPGYNRLDSVIWGAYTVKRYEYDANGNVTWAWDKRALFKYDLYNQLYETRDSSGDDGRVQYAYNAGGERVWKWYTWVEDTCTVDPGGPIDSLLEGGVMMGMPPGPICEIMHIEPTYYVRGMDKVLAEYDTLAPALPRNKYIYAGNQRIAMRDSQNRLYFYLNDHLGSAAVVVDSSGLIRDAYCYGAFGNADIGQTVSTDQSYRYTSQPLDEEFGLDIYYYGARYYEPVIGRFLSVDPLAGKYAAWGPYVYTLNNPIRFMDPDGRKPEWDVDLYNMARSPIRTAKGTVLLGPQAPGGRLGDAAVEQASLTVNVSTDGEVGARGTLELSTANLLGARVSAGTSTSETSVEGSLMVAGQKYEKKVSSGQGSGQAESSQSNSLVLGPLEVKANGEKTLTVGVYGIGFILGFELEVTVGSPTNDQDIQNEDNTKKTDSQ